MRFLPAAILVSSLALVSSTSFASVRPRHASGSAHPVVRHASLHVGKSSSHHSIRTSVRSARGTSRTISHATAHRDTPVGMAPERATEIQTALIQKGYLSGEPSGKWDTESIAAMQKLQGDNGWQTKFTPDSRALIKLGLGPQQTQAAGN